MKRKNRNPFRRTERGIVQIWTILLLFHFCIAIAAVYRSVIAGLEGNLSFFTATSTSGCEKFSCGLRCVLLCVAASFASLGLILEAFFSIEFLLAGCENEFCSAIFAFQCFVLVHLCLPRFVKMVLISPSAGL